MPIDPNRVQAVFLAAVESKDPAERGEILTAHCAGDAELCQRVQALLQAHDQTDELPGAGSLDFLIERQPTLVSTTAAVSGKIIAGRYKLIEEIGAAEKTGGCTPLPTPPVSGPESSGQATLALLAGQPPLDGEAPPAWEETKTWLMRSALGADRGTCPCPERCHGGTPDHEAMRARWPRYKVGVS